MSYFWKDIFMSTISHLTFDNKWYTEKLMACLMPHSYLVSSCKLFHNPFYLNHEFPLAGYILSNCISLLKILCPRSTLWSAILNYLYSDISYFCVYLNCSLFLESFPPSLQSLHSHSPFPPSGRLPQWLKVGRNISSDNILYKKD